MLGLPRDASHASIKAAYRRLVLSHHPDRHPADPAASNRLKCLVEAYEILGDAAARRAYDQGHELEPPAEIGSAWDELLGRIVDAFVEPRDDRKARGRDHLYRISLTVAEAARGCSKTLVLPDSRLCEPCDGRGFALDTLPLLCQRCQGAGGLQTRPGLRRVVDVCPNCEGRGYTIEDPCGSCSGRGDVESSRECAIDVPDGAYTGQRLVVRGAGQSGRLGGSSGDCFVELTVERDPVLAIDGRDIVMTRPVTWLQALLGTWIAVPTVDGVRKLRLPQGTCDGAVLRMPQAGVGTTPADRGDQRVTINVEAPEHLDDQARSEFEALAQRLDANVFPKTAAFDKSLDNGDMS